MNNPRPIILGSYSPSQNGIIVSPHGIALCIAGGGKGHDVDKPKILISCGRFRQRMEINVLGITNTLTSVCKDNMAYIEYE